MKTEKKKIIHKWQTIAQGKLRCKKYINISFLCENYILLDVQTMLKWRLRHNICNKKNQLIKLEKSIKTLKK